MSIEATHTEGSASKPECSDSSENAVKDSTAAVQVLDEEPRPKKKEAKFLSGLAPLRDSVCCVSTPVTDEQCIVLCDALKIVFNQTLHWREEDEYDEVCVRVCARAYTCVCVRVLNFLNPFLFKLYPHST